VIQGVRVGGDGIHYRPPVLRPGGFIPPHHHVSGADALDGPQPFGCEHGSARREAGGGGLQGVDEFIAGTLGSSERPRSFSSQSEEFGFRPQLHKEIRFG